MNKTEAKEILINLGYEVAEKTVEKNGILKEALVVIPEGSNVGANLYTEYLDKIESEEKLAALVAGFFENKPDGIEKVTSMFESYDNIKGLVKLGVMPDVESVYATYPSLAKGVRFYFYVNVVEDGSVRLTKEMLKPWGKTEEEVFKDASENEKADLNIKSMFDVLREMMPAEALEGLPLPEEEGPQQIVVSNGSRCRGGGVVFLEQTLKTLFERFGKFWILPSSIHESIVMVDDAAEADKLLEMVCEVNQTQVFPEDRLSNNIWFYDGETLTVFESDKEL